MKNEDIYDGVTEIRDDLIDGAARGMARRRRRSWLPAAVAAAAIALAVGAALLWRGGGGDAADDPAPPKSQPVPSDSAPVSPTPVQPGGTTPVQPGGKDDEPLQSAPAAPQASPFAVALAAYPEQPKLTDEYDGETVSLWYDAKWARQELAGRYDGSGDEFFRRTMIQFLSGGGEENRAVSPLNLYLVMAMAAETADGDSRAQILELLGAESIEALREEASILWNGTYQDDGAGVTVLANSLWMNEDADYVQETVDILAGEHHASSFRGEMGSEDYNEALRTWIDQQTGGLLTDRVQGVELGADTILALVSSIYYQAKWQDRFFAEDTAPGTFHAPTGDVTCDLMHQSGWGWYYRGDSFTAASKTFSGSGSMWFLLPDEGTDAEALLEDPQFADFLDSVRGGWDDGRTEMSNIDWTIPKFDVSSDLDLVDGLMEMGVTDVFDPGMSDFSPLLEDPEGVSISRITHTARVAIDEEGCVAAAFSMLDYGMGGPIEEMDFVLDRPFLFVITSETGLPLFAGIVNDPT